MIFYVGMIVSLTGQSCNMCDNERETNISKAASCNGAIDLRLHEGVLSRALAAGRCNLNVIIIIASSVHNVLLGYAWHLRTRSRTNRKS